MTTTYETCLNEFRDAAAMVRRHFSALAEAREVQIAANQAHTDISNKLAEAQLRLDRADAALNAARRGEPADKAEPPKVAGRYVIAPDGGIEIDEPPAAPAMIDAQANGIGIG